MLIFESLSLAALLVVPVHCTIKRQNQQEKASSVISEIEVYVTEIPSIISAHGPALATELASIISKIDPTGVVGDIPSLVSAYYPLVESLVDEFVSGVLPSGVVPTEIAAEIPTFVSEILPALVTEAGVIAAALPSSLPLSAFPGFITAYIQIIGAEVEVEASKLVPGFSSALFAQTGTASTSLSAFNGTTSPISTSTGATSIALASTGATSTASASASTGTASLTSATNSAVSKSPTVTPPAPSSTVSLASASSTWKAEICLVVGFAVILALL